jgi:hypothetical protein
MVQKKGISWLYHYIVPPPVGVHNVLNTHTIFNRIIEIRILLNLAETQTTHRFLNAIKSINVIHTQEKKKTYQF